MAKGLILKELSTNKNIGMNPFAGVYVSAIKCLKCRPEDELRRQEVFYDLSLEVARTVEDSLDQYFRTEQIEDYCCIKCSLRVHLNKMQ